MLKLIYSLVRKPGLSPQEFRRIWREEHAPLVAEAAPVLRIRRYVQCHGVDTALDDAMTVARGLARPPFDGYTELWWDSEADLLMAAMSPAGQEWAARLLEDEARFIDFSRSRLRFVQEHVVIG